MDETDGRIWWFVEVGRRFLPAPLRQDEAAACSTAWWIVVVAAAAIQTAQPTKAGYGYSIFVTDSYADQNVLDLKNDRHRLAVETRRGSMPTGRNSTGSSSKRR